MRTSYIIMYQVTQHFEFLKYNLVFFGETEFTSNFRAVFENRRSVHDWSLVYFVVGDWLYKVCLQKTPMAIHAYSYRYKLLLAILITCGGRAKIAGKKMCASWLGFGWNFSGCRDLLWKHIRHGTVWCCLWYCSSRKFNEDQLWFSVRKLKCLSRRRRNLV